MDTKAEFKVVERNSRYTIIKEYWDDLEIFTYRVFSNYNGGSLKGFLEENEFLRIPNWSNLEEFNRRYNILDF